MILHCAISYSPASLIYCLHSSTSLAHSPKPPVLVTHHHITTTSQAAASILTSWPFIPACTECIAADAGGHAASKAISDLEREQASPRERKTTRQIPIGHKGQGSQQPPRGPHLRIQQRRHSIYHLFNPPSVILCKSSAPCPASGPTYNKLKARSCSVSLLLHHYFILSLCIISCSQLSISTHTRLDSILAHLCSTNTPAHRSILRPSLASRVHRAQGSPVCTPSIIANYPFNFRPPSNDTEPRSCIR